MGRSRLGRGVAVIGAALLVTMVLPGASVSAAGETVDVRLIAFNDLHGNLDPPTGSSGRVTLPDGSTVDAGGEIGRAHV